MRVFKKEISTCKILLCTSVLVNLLLLGVVYVAESHTSVFRSALIRRNIIRGETDDTKKPDYWARMGWTNTIKKLNIDFDIAFFGNSITRGSDFQQLFPEKKIINLGYSGDNIYGMIRRVSMVKAANPKKVFIMAGTNDLVHLSLEKYKERYTTLIKDIKEELPQTKIYIESVLPSNHEMSNCASNDKVRKANEISKGLAETYGCTYIELYDLYVGKDGELKKEFTRDGVHLYPQHYDKWAERIKPFIYE